MAAIEYVDRCVRHSAALVVRDTAVLTSELLCMHGGADLVSGALSSSLSASAFEALATKQSSALAPST